LLEGAGGVQRREEEEKEEEEDAAVAYDTADEVSTTGRGGTSFTPDEQSILDVLGLLSNCEGLGGATDWSLLKDARGDSSFVT
jgi:hypothetical protein